MKKAINMRLEESTVILLNNLSKELQCTKTAIVEQAIEQFSSQNLKRHNRLMAFAGKLNAEEAKTILKIITESRLDKNIVIGF